MPSLPDSRPFLGLLKVEKDSPLCFKIATEDPYGKEKVPQKSYKCSETKAKECNILDPVDCRAGVLISESKRHSDGISDFREQSISDPREGKQTRPKHMLVNAANRLPPRLPSFPLLPNHFG